MNILLNNIPETLAGNNFTVSELLAMKKYTFRMIVVKLNDKVIKREDYPTTMITDGDHVMVLHLMSGG